MSGYDRIKEYLGRLRKEVAQIRFRTGLILAVVLFVLLMFLVATLEGFFYFSPQVKKFAVGILFVVLGGVVAGNILVSFAIFRGWTERYSDRKLAELLMSKYGKIGQRLINVIQLNEQIPSLKRGVSSALINVYTQEVADELEDVPIENVVDSSPVRKAGIFLAVVIFIVLAVTGYNFRFYKAALTRLENVRTEYEFPLPFTILSLKGNTQVLYGDTLDLSFEIKGKLPKQLFLSVKFPDHAILDRIRVEDSVVTYELRNLRETAFYEAFVVNKNIFRRWSRISSGVDTIRVISRPEILEYSFEVIPPPYTRLEKAVHQSSNREVRAYPGSLIGVNILANKEIEEGKAIFKSGKVYPLKVKKNKGKFDFRVRENDEFLIKIYDREGIDNISPIKYVVELLKDGYPSVKVLSPMGNFELNESMVVPLGIKISDDFGFSACNIVYRFLNKVENLDTFKIAFPIKEKTLPLQELYYDWNVGSLGIVPGDEMEFWIEVYDNDVVSGPKRSVSRKVFVRYPTIVELFSQVSEAEDQMVDEARDILEEVEESKKVLEEISLKLIKENEIKWERKVQIERELKKTKELGERIKKLSQKLDEVIQRSKENLLFNEEILSKLARLQEAFEQIMTPELQEAMEKLKRAIESMDKEEIARALQNFKINQERFEKELDRMLDIFERVKIEQAVDEMVKRINDMVKNQDSLSRILEGADSLRNTAMLRLANEEEKIGYDMASLEDLMKTTLEDMQKFPVMPSEELNNISEEIKRMDIASDLNEAASSLRNMNPRKAFNRASSAADKMHSAANMLEEFQKTFKVRTMGEVLVDFQNILSHALQISKEQEKISGSLKDISYGSDKIQDIMVQQSWNVENLSKLISELSSLSGKTFAVSPRVGKYIGQAYSKMRSVLRNLQEGSVAVSRRDAREALRSINDCSLEIMFSMENLLSGGQATGFKEYLKRLQQLASQQEGLNQETMKLGLGGEGGRLSLQRLAARQMQIKRALEQLQRQMRGNPDQVGDLSGIVKDMEKVIEDLKKNRVLKKTIQRQQRILTRLLDAQKSIRARGYKKKRKSRTGQDVVRESPSLPSDYGEKSSLLRENLEEALSKGYSADLEKVIRKYFEILSTEEEKSEK